MEYIQAVVGILIGGGLFAFIQFLITRADGKREKESKVLAAIQALSDKITAIEGRMDKGNADSARRRILAFDDELRRGLDHSEESYNQILQDIKFYRDFCRMHDDYENDKATSAIAHIRETYQRVKNENKFI